MTQARSLSAKSWTLDLSQPVKSAVDKLCIGIGQDLSPESVLSFAVDRGVTHICQAKGFAYDQELASSQLLTQNPDSFAQFPIASILTPTSVSKISETPLMLVDQEFASSIQKRPVLDQVVKAMVQRNLSQTLVEDVSAVADEMYTNAVFNAPFIDFKTQLNPGVSRHEQDVNYPLGKMARMFLAMDQTRLVIGCEDPFGSLNLSRYLNKIRETYVRGPAATMNYGPGGAGLGSYIIFNSGCSLYFGVWPGRSTTLCCVIPVGMGNRKRSLLPKHLHWIQK